MSNLLTLRKQRNFLEKFLASLFLLLVSISCRLTDKSDLLIDEFGVVCRASREFGGPLISKSETAALRSPVPDNINLTKLCSSERSDALKTFSDGERKTIASTLAILDKASAAAAQDYSCPWLTKEFLELTHPSKWKKSSSSHEKSAQSLDSANHSAPEPKDTAGLEKKSTIEEHEITNVVDARILGTLSRLRVLIIDGLDIVYPGELEKLKNIRHLVIQNINLISEDFSWLEKLSHSKTLSKLDFISSQDDDSVISDVKIYYEETGIELRFNQPEETKFNNCIVRTNNDLYSCPNLKVLTTKTPLRFHPSERNKGKYLLLLNEGQYLLRIENDGIYTKVKTLSKNPQIGFVRREETKCVAKFVDFNQHTDESGSNNDDNKKPESKTSFPGKSEQHTEKDNQAPKPQSIDDGFDFD